MTESNLAANLLTDSEAPHPKFRHFEVEVHESPTFNAQEQELLNLRQEVASLKQKLREKPPSAKKESEAQKSSDRLKREIKHLKLELSHTESIAKELQRSLHTQLQHNWEQQQQELIASIAKLRAIDQERLVAQEIQIQELTNQKLRLEKAQQELINSLEVAKVELAQNAKALQKIQVSASSQRESSKNISLQSILEQSIRSLQNEYLISQNRVKDLEEQIGDLQEEIVKQSAQAAEYETAVQHWKEKCIIHQNHALQLSDALERFIDGKDIPMVLESMKVDLPSFLVRPKP